MPHPWAAVTLLAALAAPGGATPPVEAPGLKPHASGWSRDRRLSFDPGASELPYNFARPIAADGRGGVHVVWQDSRSGVPQVLGRRSLDGGVTWGPELRLSRRSLPAGNPAVAAAGGAVYAAWHGLRDGSLGILFRRSLDRGATWSREAALAFPPTGAANPAIAAAAGRLHVVWADRRHGQAEVYTRRSTDGGVTWEPEQLLSEVPYESWVPTVEAAGEAVYVAWVDYRDGNEEEYFRRSTDGGATWEPAVRLTRDAADSWAPSLAVAGRTVHAVWFDRRAAGATDAEVEAQLNRALTLLGLPASPPPTRDPAVYYLPLFEQRLQDKVQQVQAAAPGWVQRGGDPEALEALLVRFEDLFRRWASGWEIFAKDSPDGGETWGPDRRLTFAPGASARPSLAAAGDELHLTWFDGRDGAFEIYTKASSDGGATWGPDLRLTRSLADARHPSIALSRRHVHVVWFDRRAGNDEIYTKRKRR